jgi:hypothetical protein
MLCGGLTDAMHVLRYRARTRCDAMLVVPCGGRPRRTRRRPRRPRFPSSSGPRLDRPSRPSARRAPRPESRPISPVVAVGHRNLQLSGRDKDAHDPAGGPGCDPPVYRHRQPRGPAPVRSSLRSDGDLVLETHLEASEGRVSRPASVRSVLRSHRASPRSQGTPPHRPMGD